MRKSLSFTVIRRADAASFLEDIQGRSLVFHRGSSGLIGETQADLLEGKARNERYRSGGRSVNDTPREGNRKLLGTRLYIP